MKISVTGRKINVGEALTQHIEERLETIADKYFSRSIEAATTLTKENHLYRVDVTLHANQGIQLKSRGEADEPYAAFDAAADKVEKQLRRYKRRLKNHHQMSAQDKFQELARDSVIRQQDDEHDMEGLRPDADLQPVIIAETKTEIPRVSVGDAVMMMDLGDSNTIMFRNIKNDGLEVVYRRADGNIGWISPSG